MHEPMSSDEPMRLHIPIGTPDAYANEQNGLCVGYAAGDCILLLEDRVLVERHCRAKSRFRVPIPRGLALYGSIARSWPGITGGRLGTVHACMLARGGLVFFRHAGRWVYEELGKSLV
jgi:hypothetical protein